MRRPLFRARVNPSKDVLYLQFSPILRSVSSSTLCYEGVKIIRLLSFSDKIPFPFYSAHPGCSY